MYCVIVGDIIRSKSLDQAKRNESTDAINRVLDYINSKYENSILASFGIVRGDAFEGILFSQQTAPKIIQDIIMGLYEEDVRVRISAAMGELSVISAERNKADGPAFYSALNRIESLRKSDSDHWFQVSMLTDSIGQPLVDGLLQMIVALTKGWTQKQAKTVWTMIRCENKQSLVSEKLNVAPSLVSKQLKAAQYEAYQAAWKGLEQYLIELEEKAIDPRHIAPTYTTYYSLANRKTEEEDYSAAIAFYNESLALATEQFGEDSPNLVRIYNGLINAYLESVAHGSLQHGKRNEYIKIISQYLETTLFCQRSLPKMRLEYARTIALHGDYYYTLRDYNNALSKYAEAIQIMEYCDQSEHPWLYEVYNNIAVIYVRQEEFELASTAYEKVLEHAKRHQENYPLNFAQTLHNVGVFYSKVGRKEDAISMLEDAISVYSDVLSAKDWRVLAAQRNLENLQAK